MYRVLPKEEARQEILRERRFNSESKRVLNKMTKFDMAQKKRAHCAKINRSILEANADAYYRQSMHLMNEIRRYYAWVRQKIQDPTTPASQKRAYRKMEQILTSRFTREYLEQNNDLMNKAGGNKSAYAFCWTQARVP